MDVSLSRFRGFLTFAVCFLLTACGDRYDLATARGQQAAIDDANMHLSHGECAQADASINPLYGSPYVTDQVRIIKASVEACYAGYNMLNFASGIIGATNYFQALAKSMSNVPNDSARSYMFAAVDVLTQNGGFMSASTRTTADNSYMVFVQLGVISAIIRNYGSPSATGTRGVAMTYPGMLTNVDACGLAAAFSHLTDSFAYSDLTDQSTSSLVSSINSICTSAGLSSCAALNRDRTQCNGVNQNSINATAVVNGVNAAW